MRLGNAMGAALTARRALGAAERPTMLGGGVLLLAIAAVAALWPASLAWPLAVAAAWMGVSLVWAAVRARD